MDTLLVGAGQMAVDYARVLSAMARPFVTVGRSVAGIDQFHSATGLLASAGGVARHLNAEGAPTHAIVAVGIHNLAEVACQLLAAGTKRILVEKPVGVTQGVVDAVRAASSGAGAEVHVAYNRRFYAAVRAARQAIQSDGGLLSVDFEFTEWIDRLPIAEMQPHVREHWAIANSSHVMDLAFHLAGAPKDWSASSAGALDWHPSASCFVGSGITDQGVLFTYRATWGAPGRWGVTLRTSKRQLRLQPLEQLFVSGDGIEEVAVEVDYALDKNYKPGLYRQVEAFLAADDEDLCSIDEHASMMHVYREIAGYANG